MTTIIPLFGSDHLENAARTIASWSGDAKLLIMEPDGKPLLRDYGKGTRVGVPIPRNKWVKSELMNAGAKLVGKELLNFHDCDVPFPENWVKLAGAHKHLKCFTGYDYSIWLNADGSIRKKRKRIAFGVGVSLFITHQLFRKIGPWASTPEWGLEDLEYAHRCYQVLHRYPDTYYLPVVLTHYWHKPSPRSLLLEQRSKIAKKLAQKNSLQAPALAPAPIVKHTTPVEVIANKILVVCSGKSVEELDMQVIRDLPKDIKIISINYTHDKLPRKDFWLTVDSKIAVDFQTRDPDCKYFCLSKSCLKSSKVIQPITFLKMACRRQGFYFDQIHLDGRNSGFAGINLAVQMGAKKIAVLGYDCGGGNENWTGFCSRPSKTRALGSTNIAAKQCKERGIEIINGSLISRCHDWPQMSPLKAVKWLEGV